MEGIVGMIKMVLSNGGTAEWLPCDGRLLNAAEYPELFALTGTRFGGGGEQFALPNVPPQESAIHVIKAKPSAADAHFQGLVAQMVLWAGEEVPANWLPCDGQLVVGADYPILQKAAAAGTGTVHPQFHLPQLAAMPGMQYIICVHGQDPTAMGGNGTAGNDDDY